MGIRKLKVGMKVYYVYADPEEKVEIWEYVVRSIRKKSGKRWEKRYDIIMPIIVRLVHKDTHTWGKLSRKQFHYGWLPNIAECDCTTFELDKYEKDGLPDGYSFTKHGAYQMALQKSIKGLKKENQKVKNGEFEEDEIQEELEYIELYEKLVSKLKGLYTKTKLRK